MQIAVVADFPILAGVSAAGPQPWSAPGLYKVVGILFKLSAQQMQCRDAKRLKRASSHWLRHSHGSHALAGGTGRAPVPIEVVRNNLGHASIGTPSGYLTTELDARLQAIEGFWTDDESPAEAEAALRMQAKGETPRGSVFSGSWASPTLI